MKIISLNTWAGVLMDELEIFLNSQLETDVFCFQEIYSNAIGKDEPHPELDMKLDLYERLCEILGDTHVGHFRPAYKEFYGQAIFVKKDIEVLEEGDVFVYKNEDPQDRGSHSRNLHYVKVCLGDKQVLIANIHGLWNGKGKTDTEDRLNQSRNIKEFLNNREEEIVLVGDFNLGPYTESLKIVGEGFRNLISEYGITSTRTSHYEKEERFADYAFVSDGIEVKDFRVLPDEPSDHSPLYLEIK